MRVSRKVEVDRTKQRAAAALEAIAGDMDTLQAECRAVSARYRELEASYVELERILHVSQTVERHLRQEIASLERPWYVRWFSTGESA
jgi:hypothetical protein